MAEHTLRILHVSDLHERVALPGISPERETKIRLGRPKRYRVLGKALDRALKKVAKRPVDLVCFTGDVADYGLREEYEVATPRIDRLLKAAGANRDRLYIVPGNHDVHRDTERPVWTKVREWCGLANSAEVSEWLAEGRVPYGVDKAWRGALMRRTAAFWTWVGHDLERGALVPSPGHGLGYRAEVQSLPFPVFVLGLDSSWLAGDDNDAGKLHLTRDQILQCGTNGEEPLPGFRIALIHHPLGDLADGLEAQRLLAEHADLVLHGHRHESYAHDAVDPDRGALKILAAGSLYEGDKGDRWVNGFHVIDAVLNDEGRPLRYEVEFWAWSEKGHWHLDSALYEGATDGRLTWPVDQRPGVSREPLSGLSHATADRRPPLGGRATGSPREPDRNRLDKDLADGTFLPFLGPLCDESAQHYEGAVPYLRARVQTLLRGLDDYGEDATGVKAYVKRLIYRRVPKETADSILADRKTKDRTKRSAGVDPAELLKVQVRLARAGFYAQKLFGTALAASPGGFTHARRAGVDWEPKGKWKGKTEAAASASALQKCLAEAQASLGLLGETQSRSCTEDCQGIDIVSLDDKTREIAQDIKGWFSGAGPREFALSHIEWLGSVLWHTLRFDVPVQPDAHDLAIHLSLCAPRARPLRVRASKAEVLCEGAELPCVQKIFRRYAGMKGRASSPLELAVAGVLRRMAQERRHNPVVATASLDRGIEAALDKLCPYMVLMPVWLKGADADAAEPAAAWALVQRRPDAAPRWSFGRPGKLAKDGPLAVMLAEIRDYPLVIKLRGSPCDEAPEIVSSSAHDVQGEDWTTTEHRLLSAEHRLFDGFLDQVNNLPYPVCHLLEGRRCYFLGFGMRNPIQLLDLQEAVRWCSSETGDRQEMVVPLPWTFEVGERDTDPYYKKVLSYLEVTPTEHLSIDELIRAMDRFGGIPYGRQ